MSLGLTGIGLNNIINPSTLVAGAELAKISKEIISTAQTSSTAQTTFINTSTQNMNLLASREASMTQAGINIQLSDKAMAAIQAIKSQAAENIHRKMDGKVFVQNSEPATQTEKSVFELGNRVNFFETSKTDKDKKGSGMLSGGMNNSRQNARQQKNLSISA